MDLRDDIIKWGKGYELKELKSLGPLMAIIHCAKEVHLITEDEFKRLEIILVGDDGVDGEEETAGLDAGALEDELEAAYDLNFETFVPPNAPLVKLPAEVKRVPLGAFLAFIQVDKPSGTHELGRRHLVHPMISLGKGKAVGLGNKAISSLVVSDGWEILDLTEGQGKPLQWIAPQGAGDAINITHAGVSQARLIRLRYRVPDSVQEQAASKWGNPKPNPLLFQRVVSMGSGQNVVLVEQGLVGGPYKGFIRPTIRFSLSKKDYEEFFNSPNEMRGHYFQDAHIGNTYTRTILTEIVEKMNWENCRFYDFHTRAYIKSFAPKLRDQIPESLSNGKIWTAEVAPGQGLVSEKEWVATHPYPRNDRWPRGGGDTVEVNNKYISNKCLFFAEMPNINETDKQAIEGYLGFGGEGLYRSGMYWSCVEIHNCGDYNIKDPHMYNVDCKGSWINAEGDTKDASGRKYGRGFQIKWFGWT